MSDDEEKWGALLPRTTSEHEHVTHVLNNHVLVLTGITPGKFLPEQT